MSSPLRPLRRAAVIALAFLVVGCGTSSTTSTTPSSTTIATATSDSAAPECETARDIANVLSTTDLSDRAGIESLPDAVRSLSTVVPAELQTDVDTLATGLDGFVQLLRDFDFDLERIDNDPTAQARLGEMNDPEITAATQRIQDWLDASCAGS